MWSEARKVRPDRFSAGTAFPICGASVRSILRTALSTETPSITAEVLDTSLVKRPLHQLECEGLPKRNATICVLPTSRRQIVYSFAIQTTSHRQTQADFQASEVHDMPSG
jgi:hypothetical protein